MVEIERGPGAGRLSKRCRIRFRSGGFISVEGEGACDDEASVARKTRTGNRSLGVAVLVVSVS
jgi:hypothetical protein